MQSQVTVAYCYMKPCCLPGAGPCRYLLVGGVVIMVWHRIRNHPGLAALLVLLLVLPAPLVWLGSSTDLLDPVLYSAVIEADVEFDAECNMVSRQITNESGLQDHVAKLEALIFEGMIYRLVSHARDMWKYLREQRLDSGGNRGSRAEGSTRRL